MASGVNYEHVPRPAVNQLPFMINAFSDTKEGEAKGRRGGDGAPKNKLRLITTNIIIND